MIDLQLDVTTQRSYLSSLALIRQRIEIGRRDSNLSAVQRFQVKIPGGHTVELFMLSSNLYLIGFAGARSIYALKEDNVDYKDAIEKSGRLTDGETVQFTRFAGDHSSLGTFARPFVLADLEFCRSLSEYSGGDDSAIKRSFALLVCMLAEGARFLEIQNSFAGIGRSAGRYYAEVLPDSGLYNHEPVSATEVVRYWDNASRARRVANGLGFGVTEGYALAVKLREGMSRLEKSLSEKQIVLSKGEMQALVTKERPPQLPAVAYTGDCGKLIKSLQELAGSKLNTAAKLDEFLVALQNKIAVDYARGLLLPTIPKTGP